LRAINAEPNDEVGYLIYADWLESRGDQCGQFLRLYVDWAFPPDKPTLLEQARQVFTTPFAPQRDMSPTRQALIEAMGATPAVWLYQVFGGTERVRQLRQKIEGAKEISRTQQAEPNRQ
jgi:uncharacterized protein (TIGR02996 family)